MSGRQAGSRCHKRSSYPWRAPWPGVASAHSKGSGSLRACSELEPSELRSECLLSHGVEAHHELEVVVERLDGNDGADTELCMTYAQAGLQSIPRGLVFV